jgi:hypothetical protein
VQYQLIAVIRNNHSVTSARIIQHSDQRLHGSLSVETLTELRPTKLTDPQYSSQYPSLEKHAVRVHKIAFPALREPDQQIRPDERDHYHDDGNHGQPRCPARLLPHEIQVLFRDLRSIQVTYINAKRRMMRDREEVTRYEASRND